MSKNQELDTTFYGSMEVDIGEALALGDIFYRNRQYTTPHFLGDPGVGKTELAFQVTDNVVVIELATKDQFDLVGLPFTSMKEYTDHKGGVKEVMVTDFAVPGELPREGKGILLFDEYSSALPEVQRACMNFMLQKRIGQYSLPNGWAIFCTSNVGELYDTNDATDPAVISRFNFIRLKTSAPSWLKWYSSQPDKNESVYNFIASKNKYLYDYESMNNHLMFANPRSWYRIGKFLNDCEANKLPVDDPAVLVVLSSFIGKAWGSVFCDHVLKHIPGLDHKEIMYSYPKVRTKFLKMRTNQNLSAVSELVSATITSLFERGGDASEYNLVMPNVLEFVLDLPEDQFMSILIDIEKFCGDRKDFKQIGDKFRRDLNKDSRIIDRATSMDQKLSAVD